MDNQASVKAASITHAQITSPDEPTPSNQPPNVIIDKLVITVVSSSEELKHGRYKQIINMQDDKESGWLPGTRGGFKAAARVHPPTTGHDGVQGPLAKPHMLVQALPKNDQGGDLRIEWNPSQLDAWQTKYLFKQLDDFLDLGPSMIAGGKVTRADIAVDLPGVQIGDFVFERLRSPLRQAIFRRGYLQTIYMGTRAKGQACVYDKAAQMGLKGVKLTRVEVRTRPNCVASELPQMNNPMALISVFDVAKANLMLGDPHARSLCRLMASNGLRAPLYDFPPKAIQKLAHAIDASPASFWTPATFWIGWLTVLQNTFPTFCSAGDVDTSTPHYAGVEA